eukprot:7612197-Ditylum_brightwellii.AAC.1
MDFQTLWNFLEGKTHHSTISDTSWFSSAGSFAIAQSATAKNQQTEREGKRERVERKQKERGYVQEGLGKINYNPK